MEANENNGGGKILSLSDMLGSTEQIMKPPEIRILELETKTRNLEIHLINIMSFLKEALVTITEEISKGNYDYESKYNMINDAMPEKNAQLVFSEKAPEEIKNLPMHVKNMFYLNVLILSIQNLLVPQQKIIKPGG